MEYQNPVIAAVVEHPYNRQDIVDEFVRDQDVEDIKVEFVPGNARVQERDANFQGVNPWAAKEVFLVSLGVAIAGLFAVVMYYNSVSVNDPNVPGEVSGTSIFIIGGIALGILTAIFSGVFVAAGIRKRMFRKIFNDVHKEDSVIVARCQSQKQAREFIKHLESKGLNKIRIFSPETVITEKMAVHYH